MSRFVMQGNSPWDTKQCPNCGHDVPPRASVCLECETNLITGEHLVPPRRRLPWFGILLCAVMLAGGGLCGVIKYRGRPTAVGPLDSLLGLGAKEPEAPPEPPQPIEAPPRVPTLRAIHRNLPDDLPVPAPAGLEPAGDFAQTGTDKVTSVRTPWAGAGTQTLVCPLCKGEGRLERGGWKNTTYRCPVCVGRGRRKARLRSGTELCGRCDGFGRVGRADELFTSRKVYVAESCAACAGRGMVTAR